MQDGANTVITALALIVAAGALYAYYRISVRADEHINHCKKAQSYWNKWRRRYSRRVQTMAKDYVLMTDQCESLEIRLKKMTDKFVKASDSECDLVRLLELYNKRMKKGLSRVEYRAFDALVSDLTHKLIEDRGYRSLKEFAPRKRQPKMPNKLIAQGESCQRMLSQ